jgi:hypothetical protein
LKIPKGGNQNPYIEEEQTTQWPQDTKGGSSESVYRRRTDNTMATRYQRGVIRIRISKKNRQHNGHKIPKGGNQNPYIEEEQTTQWPQDTKGVIRICKSKDRQYNGKKKPKNNDLQNTTQKTNDQAP